jgi:hypothetical protein
MGLSFTFQSWIDHKLKNGVYELRGTEIICGRGRRTDHRLAVAELDSWQIHPDMGFDLVVIWLVGGGQLRWIDTYDDLISILRNVAPEKEQTG